MIQSNAMEAGKGMPQQAVEPVELGPSPAFDPDSPDLPTLTPRGLQRLLNVGKKWEVRNRERVKGHFRTGRLHRYHRETVLKAMLAGQVLEEKRKTPSLGLKGRRR